MQFGLFHNLHDLTGQRDYADLLDELRELAAICDETDFDVFWMPEHHFSVWGRELLPNPLMTAVDLAARTKRIRIGLAAAIVTFWHPLRAAEDIALLDQLSGGRVEIGFGRGNYGLEASNLNPEANPNDQAKSKLVFDEAISVIKAALTQERFSFKGQVYQFPAPGFRADRAHTVTDPDYIDPRTGELIKLSIYPACPSGAAADVGGGELARFRSSTRHGRTLGSSCGVRRWRRCGSGCARTETRCARLPARTCRRTSARRSCAMRL